MCLSYSGSAAWWQQPCLIHIHITLHRPYHLTLSANLDCPLIPMDNFPRSWPKIHRSCCRVSHLSDLAPRLSHSDFNDGQDLGDPLSTVFRGPKSESQSEQNIHSIMITMCTNANGGDNDRDIASPAWARRPPYLRCKSPVKSDRCPKVSQVESGCNCLGCEIETCNRQLLPSGQPPYEIFCI